MADEMSGCRSGPRCACGALAAHQSGTCEKCRFRARWLRRKMRRVSVAMGKSSLVAKSKSSLVAR
jgi:hypothetical protein